jgi:hypothetical protein
MQGVIGLLLLILGGIFLYDVLSGRSEQIVSLFKAGGIIDTITNSQTKQGINPNNTILQPIGSNNNGSGITPL